MRIALLTAAFIWLAGISFSAFSGQYSCSSYGGAGCAEHIKDIVTDKFTSKFPHSKYEIVVVYEYQTYSNGGGVGFAVAGVSPKVAESNKYGALSLMPIRRFTATQRNTGDSINPYQKTQNEIGLIRDAVQLLMEACDRDANCDVMRIK